MRYKFVCSKMLQDEQVDIFDFCREFSLKTKNNINVATISVPIKIARKSLVVRKDFFIEQRKYPNEEVPLRDTGGLQRIFILEMMKIFHSQDLPFVTKGFSPVHDKIPFLFRNDTDYCDKKTIENYHKNIRKKPIVSWFVHCGVFENSAELFSIGKDDEFGLHCFSHLVKPTNENLRKGMNVLQKFAKKPLGFSAPYGVRNEKTDMFLKESFGFEYSSDFSFAADSLPFYVEKTGLWQIPVFPICVGSFNGVCEDENKIVAIFERYFARQFKYKTPFVIYDHPNHTKFDLLNKILEKAWEYPIFPMSFLEYCRFLKKRERAEIEIKIDDSGKVYTDSEFPVSVFYPDKNEARNSIRIKKINRFLPALIMKRRLFSFRFIKSAVKNRLFR